MADTNEKKAIRNGLLDLFEQNRRGLFFFGTGASCALGQRFGMSALKKDLGKARATEREWARAEAGLRARKTLERAQDGVDTGLSMGTKTRFREVAGDYVIDMDILFRNFKDGVALASDEEFGLLFVHAHREARAALDGWLTDEEKAVALFSSHIVGPGQLLRERKRSIDQLIRLGAQSSDLIPGSKGR
jgi:hypothetical protein